MADHRAEVNRSREPLPRRCQSRTKQYLFANATTEVEWYTQILEGEPTPIQTHRPEIPDPLAKAIHKALARKPEDRFRDVRAFSEAIREAVR